MAANITDLLDRVSDSTTGRPVIGVMAAPGKAIAAASINLVDATNWTTVTAIHFAIYNVTSAGIKDPSTQTDWKGTLAGTTISNLLLTGGTDRTYTAGAIIEITPTSRWAKDLYDWGIAQHNQNGTHGAITSTALTNTGAFTQTGTFTLNGSYDTWIGANESWAYASATTITVPADATTKYSIGDYIKITQSATLKYFVITSLTATVLTVAGLNGVTVANSAITTPGYSRSRNPLGTQAVSGGLPFNPYKFGVYRNAAQNTVATSFAKVQFDTKLFDTSSNFDAATNYRFTAPVNGFYFFTARTSATTTRYITALYKNGAEVLRGSDVSTGSAQIGSVVSGALSLAATDYIEVHVYSQTTVAFDVGSVNSYFQGYLVSAL